MFQILFHLMLRRYSLQTFDQNPYRPAGLRASGFKHKILLPAGSFEEMDGLAARALIAAAAYWGHCEGIRQNGAKRGPI